MKLPEDGTYVKFGLYPVGHCWSMHDILHIKLDYSRYIKSVDPEVTNPARHFKCGSKARLSQRICAEVFKMVLEDIIENNSIFQFPVQQGCYMKIVEKRPGFQKVLMKNRLKLPNYYKDLDLFGSESRVHEMIVVFKVGKAQKERNVWLPRKMFDRLIKLTSQGKRYLKR